ncbi:MAG: OsmC-related (seleno)protein [Anaerolineae bacterium]
MTSIESSGYPLVFKVAAGTAPPAPGGDPADRLALRVRVRALEGMQKEAVVSTNFGSTWRLVSDEGPYLDGTDLAPFPLAFYTAGMQFSFLSELVRQARAHNVELKSCQLWQDNYYTMEGSALKGTMLGGARPAELVVKIESDASPEEVGRLVCLAEASSPAQAVMRDVLANTFSLKFNGHNLPVTGVKPSAAEAGPDPEASFEAARPAAEGEFLPDIITKVSAAEKVFGVEGGAGSSLQAEQRRTLHVHGEARVVDGLLLETVIRLFKPIGSTFRFLCDETLQAGGKESAPPPLAYLSAGVGFCYMTQLGRYAHITKQNLRKYEIVQDNLFTISGSVADWSQMARALPVDTQVFLEADEPDETAQKTLSMGERTCFLHAAMRGSHPSLIRAELNGEELPLEN